MELIRFADGLLIRPSVSAFARLMELTLRKHDKKKGGQDNWQRDDRTALVDRVCEETNELAHADKHEGSDRVIAEAVDVANMAMMVADNAGGEPTDPRIWPFSEPVDPALFSSGTTISRTIEIRKRSREDIRLVYVVGPYRASSELGVQKNIDAARNVAAYLWQRGFVVICPHMNSAHLGGVISDDAFLARDLEIIERCDAAVCLPGWEQSIGSVQEVRFAEECGIPVFYSPGQIGHVQRPAYRVAPADSDRERYGWSSTSETAPPVTAIAPSSKVGSE